MNHNATLAQYTSLPIMLVQAREAVMNFYRPALHHAGITEQQWRIIRLLAEQGTLSFQDLATQACILRPSLTGILYRLEQANFVIKLKPANDHRKIFLKLTPQGEKLFKSIQADIRKHVAALETVFPPDKIQHLHTLLTDLAQIRP